ncbi:MAG: hypothetical protein ACRDSK_07860 [Actinophytocola sp.]|uniref:hypothetical protein n=1 Tax=Actinophytocola sp. TaxID=1872138 RepID=UPI003D6BBB41
MTASDADLGAKILAGWQRISRAVEDGPRMNRRLADHFGVGVREIGHLRDIRNRVAHPGPPVERRDLERALATIRQVDRRGRAPAKKRRTAGPSRTGTGAARGGQRSGTGRTSGGRRGGRATSPGPRPAGATRTKRKPRPRKAKRPVRVPRRLAAYRAVLLAVVLGVAVVVLVLVELR